MKRAPAPHRRVMRAVLGAQFFTSLADNALLIVAIGLLVERAAPSWMTPALRICLYLSYVVLAPFAGALADAFPKGRVMLVANLVKLGACLLLAFDAHPLLAFGAIGVVGVSLRAGQVRHPRRAGAGRRIGQGECVDRDIDRRRDPRRHRAGRLPAGAARPAGRHGFARARRQLRHPLHVRGIGAVCGGDSSHRAHRRIGRERARRRIPSRPGRAVARPGTARSRSPSPRCSGRSPRRCSFSSSSGPARCSG